MKVPSVVCDLVDGVLCRLIPLEYKICLYVGVPVSKVSVIAQAQCKLSFVFVWCPFRRSL